MKELQSKLQNSVTMKTTVTVLCVGILGSAWPCKHIRKANGMEGKKCNKKAS
jgi:hypothetical protein